MRPACDENNRGPQLSYDWLLSKHPQKNPVGDASKNKKTWNRVDSEGKYGRWKLLVMGSQWRPIYIYLSTQLMEPNYPVISLTDAALQFLWKFTSPHRIPYIVFLR